MKRLLIIGAAVLVQSAMAQETNQLDEPTEAPLKFFWGGYAYKSPFEPSKRIEGAWTLIPAGRDTSETNLNFIPSAQIWDEKSNSGWTEYVQSGDYEAATNPPPKNWTVISNVFMVDPDAIEKENRARLAYLNQHEDEIIKAYKVGAKKFFFIGAVLGFTLGAFCFMKEALRTNR